MTTTAYAYPLLIKQQLHTPLAIAPEQHIVYPDQVRLSYRQWRARVGRRQDVIKSDGEWVSSLQIESLISQHPAVSEVAVIGVLHEKWGERPLALVVLKPGCQVSPGVLIDLVADQAALGQISKWAVPQQLLIVPEFVRTSVGKFDKKTAAL